MMYMLDGCLLSHPPLRRKKKSSLELVLLINTNSYIQKKDS